MGGSHAIAKGFEIFERPDDFLVAGDFKKLWVFGAGMAIAHNDIAIGQNMQRSNPSKLDAR